MKTFGIVAELNEVGPLIEWSDDLGAWADVPTLGGSRWVSVSRIKTAGAASWMDGLAVSMLGCEWLAVDQLSVGGLLCDVHLDDGGVLESVALMPGVVLQIGRMRSIVVIAGAEQSDTVKLRIMCGAGACPVVSLGGVGSIPGRAMPVSIRSAPDSVLTETRYFGQTTATALSVIKLATWSGRRFAGGVVSCSAVGTAAHVDFLVGPDVALPSSQVPALPALTATLAQASVVGMSSVGLVTTAGASIPGVMRLSAESGVGNGYPGSQSLYARVGFVALSALYGSILLRAGEQ